MIDTLITLLVTKTGILRWAAAFAAGWLAQAGIIKQDQSETIIAAIVTILAGALSFAVSHFRKTNVKMIQEVVGTKPDGYVGPKTVDKILEMTMNDGTPVRRATRA